MKLKGIVRGSLEVSFVVGKGDVVREHFPPKREGERNDEKHEQGHLCYEEQEDLEQKPFSVRMKLDER